MTGAAQFSKIWEERTTGITFVFVVGGCYRMGCGRWAQPRCNKNEKPAHDVYLSDFWISKYPTTNAQFVGFLNQVAASDSKDVLWINTKENVPESRIQEELGRFSVEAGYQNHPVVEVSWYGAKAFAGWLCGRTGHTFRLPTEAEWEYACRSGGKLEIYAGGHELDRFAWYNANSGATTHPVGLKAPNGLGLYDMCGNVWEWCEDIFCEKAYSKHECKNPLFVDEGFERVVRGGGYGRGPGGQRCTYRLGWPPNETECNLGFRLVMINGFYFL